MNRFRFLLIALIAIIVLSGAAFAAGKAKPAARTWQDTFDVAKEDLANTGRNDYYILEPGYRLVLAGREGKDKIRVEYTVLDATEVVDGVNTRVVEERRTKNGVLVEVTRNYIAISTKTKDVYYFGEAIDVYENGQVVGHDCSWRSGLSGARFGLLIPAAPRVGQRYIMENAPGLEMDQAEIRSRRATIRTPAGTFKHCVELLETSGVNPHERATEYFARGVGLVADGRLRLVEYGPKK